MIHIKRSSSADTRSARELVSREKLLNESLSHIHDVREALMWMGRLLRDIALRHDWTKVEYIDEFHADFPIAGRSF